MFKKFLFAFCAIICSMPAFCQIDTASIIKDYSKVLSFSSEKYLYYETITTMNASPVLKPEDTATLKGVFYKNDKEIYYASGYDEIFFQDSLLIKINKSRKTVWIGKQSHKKAEDPEILPLKNLSIEELFQKKYVISKSGSGGNVVLNFDTKPNNTRLKNLQSSITVEYEQGTHLPVSIGMLIKVKEPVSETLLAAAKDEDVNKLIVKDGDQSFFVRTQKVNIQFQKISKGMEAVKLMPSWKSKISYEENTGEFRGRNEYAEYEIKKLF